MTAPSFISLSTTNSFNPPRPSSPFLLLVCVCVCVFCVFVVLLRFESEGHLRPSSFLLQLYHCASLAVCLFVCVCVCVCVCDCSWLKLNAAQLKSIADEEHCEKHLDSASEAAGQNLVCVCVCVWV